MTGLGESGSEGDNDGDPGGGLTGASSAGERLAACSVVSSDSHHESGTASGTSRDSNSGENTVGLHPNQPNSTGGLNQVSLPTSPDILAPLSITSPSRDSPCAAPPELHVSEVLNPRFDHIWRRRKEVGACEIVRVSHILESKQGRILPSLGEGGGQWSMIGGDSRSFAQVIRSKPQMQGWGGYAGQRREGFGAGRAGRGTGRTEARSGPRGWSRGRGGWQVTDDHNRENRGFGPQFPNSTPNPTPNPGLQNPDQNQRQVVPLNHTLNQGQAVPQGGQQRNQEIPGKF